MPKKTIYFAVDSEQIRNGSFESVSGNFGEIPGSGIPGNKFYVRFDLHIEVSEAENSDFDRQKNDLGILLDESLLTDSVLRVNGKEIPVHRAILAAMWPSFYEKFLAESKDPVVDVGEIDPDVFTQLLQCVYSKRIPDSLFEDTDCIGLAHTLDQTWFLEQIQTREPQQASSPNIIPVFDLDLHMTQRGPLDRAEIGVSAEESITYRSFAYRTVVTKETYKQSRCSLGNTIKTIFSGKDDNVTATWYLSLKETEWLGEDYCQLTLVSLNKATTVRARTRFSVWNSEGQAQYTFVRFNQFDPEIDSESKVKYPFSSYTQNRVGNSPSKQVLGDDELTLWFEIDIQLDGTPGELNTTSSDDLGNLLIDDRLSDVVLCVGDRKFPVHPAILAARSPVFRAMFTSNMKESVAEEISFEDIEPDVMKEFLRCVYTNQVPLECGCDMLIAFDRFGLISLLDRCQDSVTITVENALEVFAVAEELNLSRLKRRILKFLMNREMRLSPSVGIDLSHHSHVKKRKFWDYLTRFFIN